ncbi:hypothetical protein [Fluviispira sanaruensis]|uniref:Uncharacterized protein n=1 Tax=Fluviispira sanaruensis TaxID=2493639 RepID=A0A4P2VKB2_FLUSA|nr:hypothetical protein [Fluviispira sanaruensis]BBH52090.1 hypothetical protein JCM31447_05270 [Fluviispira sanaruensis]
MEMKRFNLIYICFFLIILQENIYAMNRADLIELSSEIVQIYENKKEKVITDLDKEKIEQKFYDIKEIVQADLKSGNKNVSIDIYLFLKGLLKNDITSLQSLISADNIETFAKDLAQLIHYSAAQKLSFALKENRIAYKTSIHIKQNTDQKNCQVYWNGKPLENIKPIFLPVGVPVYISLFCPNNLFEVKYIQSSETQRNLTVVFDQLKKIQFNNKDMMPNPNKNIIKFTSFNLYKRNNKNQIDYFKAKENNQTAQTETNENNQLVQQLNHTKIKNINVSQDKKSRSIFAIGSGFSMIYDFGYLRKINASQFGMSKGLIFTLGIFAQFKGFLFLFDYAKIDAYNSKSLVFINGNYNGNNAYNYETKIKYSYFKPSLGYRFILNDTFKNYSMTLDALLNYSSLISTQTASSSQGVGFQFAFGLSKQIIANFNWDFSLGSAYSLGTLRGFQLISSTRLSYFF